MARRIDAATDRPSVQEHSAVSHWHVRDLKFVAYWIPAFVAVVFMATAAVVLMDLVGNTREIAKTNLLNTCFNASRLGSPNAEQCWEDYSRLSGEPRPATAGSTVP